MEQYNESYSVTVTTKKIEGGYQHYVRGNWPVMGNEEDILLIKKKNERIIEKNGKKNVMTRLELLSMGF